MCQKIARVFLLSILLFFGNIYSVTLYAAAVTQLKGVRISHSAGVTRFVFDMDGAANYQLSEVNKGQIFLIIHNIKKAESLPKIKGDSFLISDYKINSQANNNLQIIFNVNKNNIKAKAFILTPASHYGHRLVVDIKEDSIANNGNQKLITKNKLKSFLQDPLPKSTQKVASKPLLKPKVTLSAKRTGPIVIVIDPGHGGKDPGAIGAAGHQEKHVVLSIAKVLQRMINQQPGFRAELTRTKDTFIPLRQRLAIARQQGAHLFIAVHADAYANTEASGASVFALSERGATSEMARWLAEKENQSELVDGVFVNKDQVLRSVLLDLSQTHCIGVSLEMGHAILHHLSNFTRLHFTRVEQAAFVVLKSPDIPSLLVETGYLSNARQEKLLMDPNYQHKIAAAIVAGIKSYFSRHSAESLG